MILVGALRPAVNGSVVATRTSVRPIGEGAPQLRGILLHRSQLPTTLTSLLPPGLSVCVPSSPPSTSAIEHGWFPCVTPENVLRFAFQSQEGELLLPPATLASLPALGFRLWRKGQSTFALAPRSMTVPPSSEWDQQIKEFLQQQQQSVAH